MNTNFVNQPVAFLSRKGVKQMLKFFVALQNRVAELRDRQDGQAYVEYGVLLAIVAIGLIATMGLFKTDLVNAFDKVRTAVQGL
jgi:Flp pilus assembly pilin Flp